MQFDLLNTRGTLITIDWCGEADGHFKILEMWKKMQKQ